jgi:hypothetical protein
MRTDLLLPPSLPEHERKADYDYEIVDRKAIILPRSEELPASDQERCEWRIGIRRATFDSIRPVRLPPISDKVSNWGVYFTKAQHGPEEVTIVAPSSLSITKLDAGTKISRPRSQLQRR